MERVAEPLRRMGAGVETTDGHAPVRIEGRGPLRAIAYASPVASAQVKSAILIAGLRAAGTTRVTEPERSRDHTERMLGAMGADIAVEGTTVELRGGAVLAPLVLDVPGDPSAAAFTACAAAIVPGSRVCVRGMSANATRTAFVDVLARMGAPVVLRRCGGGIEPVGDLEIEAAPLRGTTIEAAEVPRLVDEIPVLCAVAAYASGPTRIAGAGELRHKESDRLSALAAMLRAVGVPVDEHPDGLVVHGGGPRRGGRVEARGDHRMAMAATVLALGTDDRIEVVGGDVHGVSDPGFHESLARLRNGTIEIDGRADLTRGVPPDERTRSERSMKRLRVAIDGPSASGKTTTARAVAERLGYRYLDSGALYRALALEVLRRGVNPDDANAVMEVAGEIEAGYLDDGHVSLFGRDVEKDIRTSEVAECASRLSVHPPARAWVNARLREAAARGGVVMEGRDIGTVVLPDAEVKVFLEAELPVRARRRQEDLAASGREEPLAKVTSDLDTRDHRDASRAEAPLVAAEDAVRVDGSTMTFEEQVEAVLRAVAEHT
jgi:3-phosphoshikimate 1-carboxyvinyltransferase